MDMLRCAREEKAEIPISPAELDGEDLHEVEVRREWKHIDLLIVSDRPRFVLVIENKIDAGEGVGQLERYRMTVCAEFPGIPALYVFLAAGSQEASEDDWVDYSYERLHSVLSRVRRTTGGSLGADVGVFLDHYLSLIGSRFMNDTKIEELCKRVYANHRRAIDLIMQHAGAGPNGVLETIRDAISGPGSKWAVDCTSSRLYAVPKEWIGTRVKPDFSPVSGEVPEFFIEVGARSDRAYFRIVIGRSDDPERRKRMIERVLAGTGDFKFRMKKKTITDKWTRVFAQRILTWDEDEPPDEELLRKSTLKCFDEALPAMIAADKAMREVL